jgi:hypothetical protein
MTQQSVHLTTPLTAEKHRMVATRRPEAGGRDHSMLLGGARRGCSARR